MPDSTIPSRARIESFDVEERYGLIWVRLRSGADTTIPACPAWDDPGMHIVPGEPYTWPVSAARRVENFTDLSHFAWVHDGSLGRRDLPVPPVPDIERVAGEMRFEYLAPPLDEQQPAALVGMSWYRMPMPATVCIEFEIAGKIGARRHLWMTASPIDDVSCRSFWLIARNDALDESDEEHLRFQALILAEDEPVVRNQVPAAIPVAPGAEISVRTDRVSIEYRRWLGEIRRASHIGAAAIDESVHSPVRRSAEGLALAADTGT